MSVAPVRPVLDEVFFERDGGEHDGGGHCVAFRASTQSEVLSLVDEYLSAFCSIVEGCEPDNGFRVDPSQPAVFMAHHCCELAMKAVVIERKGQARGEHDLRELWAIFSDALGTGIDTTTDDHLWAMSFIEKLSEVSGASFWARYGNVLHKKTADPSDKWCCVSPSALLAATNHFTLYCIGVAQEVAEMEADKQ